jgi:hypothetical protein
MHSLLCCRVLLNLQRAGAPSGASITPTVLGSSRSGGGIFTTLAFSDEAHVDGREYEMESRRGNEVEEVITERMYPQSS